MARILPLMLILGLNCCSKAGEPEPSDPAPQQREIGVGDGDSSLAGSTVIVTFEEDTRTDTLEGYVIGYRETMPLLYNAAKKIFLFKQVPEGVHDILVFSQDSSGNPIGRRINGITVSPQQGALIKDVHLLPLRSLSGSAMLNGSSSDEDIAVDIPGTHLFARTDESGTYTLEGVPEGIHRLEFNYQDYQTGFISLLNASGSEDKPLPKIILSHETNRGIFPVSTLDNLDVSFLVNPPKNANEFRISTNQNFAGSEWQKLISTVAFTFDQEGTHTIYIQFANNGTQLSSIFSHEFEIILP